MLSNLSHFWINILGRQVEKMGESRRWLLVQEIVGLLLIFRFLKASDGESIALIGVFGVAVGYFFHKHEVPSVHP